MSKISWDESGSKRYFAGLDRGVFYPANLAGVPWNGLISVTPNDESVLETQYLDGNQIRQESKSGSFAASLKAYTYPDEFSEYDGVEDGLISQQSRSSFGLSYRTLNGDETESLDLGYKIHLVYNAIVAPTNSAYSSIETEVDPIAFEWPISTKPLEFSGIKPFSHIIIDSTLARPQDIIDIENLIYGSTGVDPELPTIQDILDLFQANSTLKITDNGDGTWTANAPGSIIQMLDSTTFEITWPSAVFIDDVSYNISSF